MVSSAKNKNGGVGKVDTVLIVEDQELLLTLLESELGAAGYKVVISNTGEDALSRLESGSEEIALILLDLMLPKVDGFEVLRKLKADDRLKNIPVVILSNLGEEENIKKAYDLGAIDYFIKSDMTPDKIIEVVKKIDKGN